MVFWKYFHMHMAFYFWQKILLVNKIFHKHLWNLESKIFYVLNLPKNFGEPRCLRTIFKVSTFQWLCKRVQQSWKLTHSVNPNLVQVVDGEITHPGEISPAMASLKANIHSLWTSVITSQSMKSSVRKPWSIYNYIAFPKKNIHFI